MNAFADAELSDRFRPDIEGLRAVAVIAVLLFHLGFARASGGFVGVDVFFVVSGFLIGGIVVREAAAGSFSVADYLERRVRRIVPAMLAVLAAVSLVAAVLLLPGELTEYAASLGSSTLFIANIHFWLHRGAYAESDYDVLLHMWTLGVEGQFYLLLPLLVLALAKLGRRGLWFGLVAVALGSAAVSLIMKANSGFYMMPPRLWEFLAGTMVAITPLPFLKVRWVREGLAITGLVLIVYAVTAFHAETPFPGWRAAIPCAGAAAIIAAGSNGRSVIGDLLTLAPVRFLGRISYSLYLWHWPVIVVLLLGLPAGELDTGLRLVATIVSLALAVLTWRYVEEPFRRRSVPRGPLLAGSGLVAAGLVGMAFALTLTAGWPQRFSERGRALAEAIDYPQDRVLRSGTCFIHHRSQRFDADACIETGGGRSTVLLLGDSHAAHLGPGLRTRFRGSAISQVTAAGCRPVLEQGANQYPFCTALIDWALTDYVPTRHPDLVVLAGRWEERDLPALAKTLTVLRGEGQAALLVGPAAEWAQPVPRLLAIGHERGQGTALADSLLVHERKALDRRMARLAKQQGAAYVSLYAIQCEPECVYFDQSGSPLVVDDSHFTREASIAFAGQFAHPKLVRNLR